VQLQHILKILTYHWEEHSTSITW